MFMTSTEVKSILGLSTSTTTYDTDISIYTPIVMKDIVAITNNDFKEGYRYVLDDELVIASTGTITISDDSTSKWTLEFQANDTVLIEGSWWNSGYFTVSSRTSDVLILSETLTSENSTDFDIETMISRCKFPDYVKTIGAKMIWYKINNKTSIDTDFQSEHLGDYSYTKNNKGSDVQHAGYPAELLKGLKRVVGMA